MSNFAGTFAKIEQIAGTEAAQRLALRAGGTSITLSARPGSQLVQIVGSEAARKLVEALGGGRLIVPMAHLRGEGGRRAAIAKALEAGASQREAAQLADVHERTARRVAQRIKAPTDASQGDLFSK